MGRVVGANEHLQDKCRSLRSKSVAGNQIYNKMNCSDNQSGRANTFVFQQTWFVNASRQKIWFLSPVMLELRWEQFNEDELAVW